MRTEKVRGDIWGLLFGALVRLGSRHLDTVIKHLGWFHDGTQGATEPPIHVAEPNLVAGVHPAKALAWDELEIYTNVAVLDLNLVCHPDHIKFLRDTAIKVYERLCNAGRSMRTRKKVKRPCVSAISINVEKPNMRTRLFFW